MIEQRTMQLIARAYALCLYAQQLESIKEYTKFTPWYNKINLDITLVAWEVRELCKVTGVTSVL